MALERLLVAIGPGDAGSVDEIAGHVRDIAGPADAAVTILHVFAPDHFADLQENLMAGGGGVLEPDTVARRHATVRQLRRQLSEAALETTVRGAIGDPPDEIIRVADEVGADLLVVGGRARSPTGKAVFGSTAQAVLREAPAPVVFVRRRGRERQS
ncbi:MAG: universal stress protein [Halobacteriaceae archaeon]